MDEDGAREHHVARDDADRVQWYRLAWLAFGRSQRQFSTETGDPPQVARPLGQAVSPALGNALDTDARPNDAAHDRGVRVRVAATEDDGLHGSNIVIGITQPGMQD